MAADIVGGILLASVTLYAVLGGADFGGGLWDLLAGPTRRGRAPRDLIDESITPVWEANHVWLVFDLVIFWTAFPHAFAAVMTVVACPCGWRWPGSWPAGPGSPSARNCPSSAGSGPPGQRSPCPPC